MYIIEIDGGDSMKIKIILSMLFLMILFPLCKKEGSTYPEYIFDLQIEGVVTYSDTNEPIANCSIHLWRDGGVLFPTYEIYETESDEDGRYSIRHKINSRKDCVGGTLELSVFIEGQFKWTSDHEDHYISCEEGLQIIDIEVSE